jgi:membrane protein DedA with SNARE-associated domain
MIDVLLPLSLFDASQFFGWFVENASYLFVFVFMAIESSFIPFPSEVIVPPAAYLAVQNGNMNVFVIVLVATAGAIFGALINYYLSLWVGRPIVYSFANSRIGHACLIDQAKVENAERYFDKHGAISTFIGRLIPAVRQLISIPAGLARMNIWAFILFSGLGAMVWNGILAGLGWWLGTQVPLSALYEQVEKYNSYLSIGGMVIAAVCVVFIIYNAFRSHNSSNATTQNQK